MKETGFPSPFIDIMMLRQASRTSQTCRCRAGSTTSTTASGKPWSAMHWSSRLRSPLERVEVLAGELDEQQAVRLAPRDVGERAPEERDVGAEHQHVVVDELDRDRPERHDMPRRLHRGAEGREVAHAHDAMRRQGRELQRHLGRERERAFRADEEMGEVRHRREQRVEIVAADPALHLRETRLDLVALALREAEHPRRRGSAPGPSRRLRRSHCRPGRTRSARRREAGRRRASTLSTILP